MLPAGKLHLPQCAESRRAVCRASRAAGPSTSRGVSALSPIARSRYRRVQPQAGSAHLGEL